MTITFARVFDRRDNFPECTLFWHFDRLAIFSLFRRPPALICAVWFLLVLCVHVSWVCVSLCCPFVCVSTRFACGCVCFCGVVFLCTFGCGFLGGPLFVRRVRGAGNVVAVFPLLTSPCGMSLDEAPVDPKAGMLWCHFDSVPPRGQVPQ